MSAYGGHINVRTKVFAFLRPIYCNRWYEGASRSPVTRPTIPA